MCLPGDVLVGARRGKPFSCSGDLGQTWTVIEGAGNGLYQPCIRLLPDGRAAAFGHCGADSAVGQTRMAIAADLFRLDGAPPAGCELSLERVLSADGSHYGNAYTARLTCKGSPVAGRRVTFRVVPFWTEDGAVNTLAQEQAPIRLSVVTDADGLAHAAFPAFDAVRDIHFAYTIDAFAEAAPGQASCVSASRCELAMTPYRRCRHPYPAYFAENTLYLSPELEKAFPDCRRRLAEEAGRDVPAVPDAPLRQALLDAGVLRQTEDGLRWIARVHGAQALGAVLPQPDGDWYI